MKVTKRLLGTLFATAVILFGIGLNVYAAAYEEKESNDTNVTANAIELNQTYRGSLSAAGDIDWYKFTVTKRGYFQVRFSKGPDADTAAIHYGWDGTLYEGNAVSVIESATNFLSYWNSAKEPFEPGDYYIKVEANFSSSSSYAPVNVPYDISVDFTETKDWEVEYNDENYYATKISANKEVKGHLYNTSDVDWFKYTVSSAGTHSFSLRVDDMSSVDDISYGWAFKIYDSNYKEIDAWSNWVSSGETYKYPLKAGTYFIRLSSSSSTRVPVEVVYDLKVNFTKTSVWETENNNKSSQATKLKLNTTYRGNLHVSDDIDWYKFTTKSAGRVQIDFKADNTVDIEKLGDGWAVEVYKSTDGTKVLASKSGIDTAERSRLTLDLAKGSYYIKISPDYANRSPYGQTYTVKASFAEKPSQATLSSVKAGTKAATLTWKKVSNATGYIVYRSTSKNGTFSKIKTIKDNATVTFKNTGLKKGKTYYYYVKSYNKANGVTAYGAISAKKSVKIK